MPYVAEPGELESGAVGLDRDHRRVRSNVFW